MEDVEKKEILDPAQEPSTDGDINREDIALLITGRADGNLEPDAVAGALVVALEAAEVRELIVAIVRKGGADELKALVGVVEILMTPSAMEDPEKVEALTQAAQMYGLRQWLERRGDTSEGLTRDNIMMWWDFFMEMSATLNVTAQTIDNTSQETNLWKATSALASKMSANQATYRFLPPYLINHPTEVDRVLGEIKSPVAFLEVLTGESWEDLQKSPEFLEAFVGVEPREGQSIAAAVIETIMLALQNPA